MGTKVNAIEALRDRINAEIGVGKILEPIIRVRVGSIEEVRKGSDYPIINISLDGGEEIFEQQQTSKTDNMDIEIQLVVNKETGGDNALFDIANGTGLLFLLEKLLNVIDNDSSGNVDLTLNSTLKDYIINNYRIEAEQGIFIARINLTLRLLFFQPGAR